MSIGFDECLDSERFVEGECLVLADDSELVGIVGGTDDDGLFSFHFVLRVCRIWIRRKFDLKYPLEIPEFVRRIGVQSI